MQSAPLLIEIRCEEIPARMIPRAAADLGARVTAILDQAGLAHGACIAWGGSRRVAVRVEDVAGRQADREEQVLGPAAAAAFGADGSLTPAGLGFAKKQGIDPSALTRVKTDKGEYVGFRRRVEGKDVGAIVAEGLPPSVAAMSFPKTMRWADGVHRWVRPVHGVLALHGRAALAVEIFGVCSEARTEGHRFLSSGPVPVAHPDEYAKALEGAHVVADPAQRRARLERALHDAAAAQGGRLVEDPGLLDEIADLVEWPGVVVGTFDDAFLELPEEILVTTLRHHQKAFSVKRADRLAPAFLAIANTDRDRAGHVRRGNEWVVSGRLEDARFFWREDRKRSLGSRVADLAKVTFHAKVGSYADKADRLADLAARVAAAAGLTAEEQRAAREAGHLAKADLVTGLVGEFPELQGIVGGLLARADDLDPAVASAIYEHYRPAGASDALPFTAPGAAVSIADKLHTCASLIAAGETPTGSRDPFGLRRAMAGVFRVVEARAWRVTLADLASLAGGGDALAAFLDERFESYERDRGCAANEYLAVTRPRAGGNAHRLWPIAEISRRLDVVATLRGRDDFARLVELTKRVDNILVKTPAEGVEAAGEASAHPSEAALRAAHADLAPRIQGASREGRFEAVADLVAAYAAPVSTFFDDVLVLDPADPAATARRCALLAGVRDAITRDFDIRELAGQADRRS